MVLVLNPKILAALPQVVDFSTALLFLKLGFPLLEFGEHEGRSPVLLFMHFGQQVLIV